MAEASLLDRSADRRRYLRNPVRFDAELTLRGGEAFYDCTVIDQSAGGVQVELAGAIELPDEVVIRFSDHASQLVRRCWSLGTRVGYQFIDPPSGRRRADQNAAPGITFGDFVRITPEAVGLPQNEMLFHFPAERISALLRD